MSVTRPVERHALEAAADWYVNLRDEAVDTPLRDAHRCWLESNPQHRLAWDRLALLQDKLAQVKPTIAVPTLEKARAQRRAVLKVLSLLIAAGGSGTLAWRGLAVQEWAADQRTGTGQRRAVRLADGTRLQLNTDTAVNVRYSNSVREVILLRGEIHIETAPDSLQRPFVVHTAEGSLRALGTRFVVRRDEGFTWLSVQEHAVEVRPAQHLDVMLRVEAAQQVRFSALALGSVTPADPQVDAWTRDMLVVSNWRLEAFVETLQRYRPGYLRCDSQVADLRVSGAFYLGDTQEVLRNLAATLPIRVTQFTPYWVRIGAV